MAALVPVLEPNTGFTVQVDDGTVDVTSYLTFLETSGADDAVMQLNDGQETGQLKKLQFRADGGGNAAVTSTQMHDGTTITFTTVGQVAVLMWDGTRWRAVLLTDAAGGTGPAISGPPTPGGTVTCAGSSTDNAIVRFDGTTGCVIQNSTVIVSDTGAITGAESLTLSPAAALAVAIEPFGAGAGDTGELRFLELAANGTDYVGFKGPDSIAASVIWTLPNADGAAGDQLTTNGAGVLSWTSSGGAGVAPTAIGADTTTITIAQILTEILTRNMGAAGTWTIDTAANVVAGFPGAAVNSYAEFSIINEDTGGLNDITVAAGAGGSFVGNTQVPSAAVTAHSELSSGQFRIRLTNVSGGTEAYIVYRLA